MIGTARGIIQYMVKLVLLWTRRATPFQLNNMIDIQLKIPTISEVVQLKKKWLAVGIILMFVVLSWSPVTHAGNTVGFSSIDHHIEKTVVRVNCYEYKSDGSIEKTTILIPKSEYLKMTQNLSLTTAMEEKLKVYQRYGIIPTHVTIQKMKEHYDHYLISKNINVSAIQKNVNHRKPISEVVVISNSNCKIDASGQYGIHMNIGMSMITRFWNFIALFLEYSWDLPKPPYLPGIDLCDFNINAMGLVKVYLGGPYPNITWFDFFIMMLFGFVGYYIEFTPFPLFNFGNVYIGYTVLINVVGKRGSYSHLSEV